MAVDRVATVRLIIDGWLSEEVRLLAMTSDERKLFNYSDGVRSYDWQGYMRHVKEQVKDYSGQLGQILSGPFEISQYLR